MWGDIPLWFWIVFLWWLMMFSIFSWYLYVFFQKMSIQGKDTRTPMFMGSLFSITKMWKQPKCLSTVEWLKKICHISTNIHIFKPINHSNKYAINLFTRKEIKPVISMSGSLTFIKVQINCCLVTKSCPTLLRPYGL